MKPKRPKSIPFSHRGKPVVSPHGHMIREAFQTDRRPKKPLLVREKPKSADALWGTFLLWVVLLAVAVFTVFFSDFHVIRHVEVVGVRNVPTAEIEAFVFGRMSERRFRFFPADNFFLVPTSSLERETLLAFPKLSGVTITRRFPDSLRISVTERDRILLWCSAGPCSLVGDDGIARDAVFAETQENEPFLIRVVDTGARPVDVGMPLLSSSEVDAVYRLERGLREQSGIGFSPVFASPSRVSDEIRITTDEGWDILAGLDIDPDKTIASLQLVLDKEIPSGRRPSLRYIDLRTENRAYYAFKGPNGASDGATASTQGAQGTPDSKKSETGRKK